MSKPKPTLNQTDINLIKNLIVDFTTVIVKQETKEIIESLGEKINHLPTKDEFSTQMSKVMGELQDIREEITIGSQQTRDNRDDIEDLKKLHSPSHPHFSRN